MVISFGAVKRKTLGEKVFDVGNLNADCRATLTTFVLQFQVCPCCSRKPQEASSNSNGTSLSKLHFSLFLEHYHRQSRNHSSVGITLPHDQWTGSIPVLFWSLDASVLLPALVKTHRRAANFPTKVHYYLAKNNSFDALQAYCFGINIKL